VDVALVDVLLGSRTARDVMIETPGLAEVPLILMTAHDAIASVGRDLPRTAHLLRKPFDLVDLERAIDEAVSESAAG
jgi:two-component SAPR family response regulator